MAYIQPETIIRPGADARPSARTQSSRIVAYSAFVMSFGFALAMILGLVH